MVEDIPPLHKGHLFVPCTPSIRRYKKSRWRKPSAFLVSSSPVLSAACPRRLCQPPWTQPSCKEPRPTLRRNQLQRIVPTQTPAALRERGVWGERGFSQRSRLSPKNLPTISSSEGGPGEGLLAKKPPPPAHLTEYTLPSRPDGFSFRRPSFGTFRWCCPERRRKRSCFPQHRAG